MHFRKTPSRIEPHWKTPVRVKVARWRLETIASPAQALEKLANCWPSARGRHYRSAVTNCEAAVSCQYSSELAREAFVRAALEAAILLEGDRPDPPQRDAIRGRAGRHSLPVRLTADERAYKAHAP
ncbi:DUF982 domain-containing protein [Rhizobium deserti]|uniref:DUF982 domain-containing protein n=1 Tax=Rhizobium deserti TaxID=2547961 RepID=A0A4R5UPG1_9HYPH|nr:DUF982 domain-containing protein [Rhizobium deserti]